MITPPTRDDTVSQIDVQALLALRLLIARAGGKDSLNWWDDDALSAPAEFLLQRAFPAAPALAARRLAIEAAGARHRGALLADTEFVHLYRLTLDNRDRLATRFHKLESIPAPAQPITTPAALRAALLQLTGRPLPYAVERRGPGDTLKVAVPPASAGTDPLIHRAQTLAWAYLEAGPGRCIIPYCAGGAQRAPGDSYRRQP